ncbi:hypothetical protein FQN54_007160 [Arachnomyces sp. PD_36]|nr:hypothetical protein FQN54_007160 [Arachnomyces sp. PD_36]
MSRRGLGLLLRESTRGNALPAFLVPALSLPQQQSYKFSTSSPNRSRIGGAPVSIPSEVSLKFSEMPPTSLRSRDKEIPKEKVEISGPLGQMTLTIPPFLKLTHDEASKKATFSVDDATLPRQRAMWGTTRAHLQNYVLGVSEGHICILSLVGVGYRATIEENATTVQSQYPGQKFVNLKVGFSHPVELGIPEGVKASTPQPTRILLEGIDKEVVTQFAAEIREWRRPEPYKGKGIFVNGETIKLKAKKIK